MNADRDYLIGLAAVYAGLLSPRQLPREASDPAGPTLSHHLDETVLERARALADHWMASETGDLGQLIQRLSEQLRDGPEVDSGKATVRNTDTALAPERPVVSREEPGRYQYAREHARGGMGRILQVYDRVMARRIALKELLPSRDSARGGSTVQMADRDSDPSDREQRARFLHEARITGYLEHPAIVPVYELGERADGALYYTMRLVKGRSLHQAIRRTTGLAERLRLLPHFMDLCQAIAYAHSRGVVHRDIKPGNIMLGEFGETVVIDWGIARAIDGPRDEQPALTAGGAPAAGSLTSPSAAGTPAYMPPEQAAGDDACVNERTDVYSLGAVLYELLSGNPPYEDRSPAATLQKLLAGAPPALSESVPDAPEQLMAICRHAMARNPNDRYQTARELAADIERFLSGRLVGVYNYSLGELLLHTFRSFKAPLIVGAIGAAALVATTYLSYQQIQAERDNAIAESTRAQEAEKVAREAQRLAEQQFYAAAIASARKYIADGRFEKAMDQLDKCPPRFRHWEWGYLLYLCNQDIRTLRAHEQTSVWSLAWLPDGAHLATAGFDDTVRLWSANSDTPVRVYESPHGSVIELAPHPRQPILALAAVEGFLSFYNWEDGAVTHSRRLSETDVNCVQYSPDGSRYLTGDDAGILRMWDAGTHRELYAIEPEDGGIEAIAFHPSGAYFASCNRGTTITWRHTETGQLQHRLRGHTGRITAISFSPDGRRLASASRDETIRVWDLKSGAEVGQLSNHGSAVWDVVFSPDGQLLASSSSDLKVLLWDTKTWKIRREYRGHQKQVYCIAFSPDGRLLSSGDDEGMVKTWYTDFPGSRTEMWELAGHTGMINHVAYSPDGSLMVTSAGHWRDIDDTTARVWDADSCRLIQTLTGHDASVRQTRFHPDSPVYATGSKDGTIRIWDRNTHETRRVIGPFDSGVNTAAFDTGDGHTLAAGLRDGRMLLIDWREGRVKKQWKEHREEVLNVAYSPDGKWLVSTSADDSTHVMDAKSGRLVTSIEAHNARVPAIAFSPDASRLATGGHDWKIRLWNTATWELERVMEGHTEGIYSLQFTEDGRRLLSSGSDNATILWDMDTYREVLQISGWVSAIRPGGQDILTGTRGFLGYLWPAFPWEPATYGANPDVPLRRRVEAYKQKFWRNRRPQGQGTAPAATVTPAR